MIVEASNAQGNAVLEKVAVEPTDWACSNAFGNQGYQHLSAIIFKTIKKLPVSYSVGLLKINLS